MTTSKTTPILSLALLSCAVSAAWAADAGYTTLDESVVSASGYEQDTREAPASISITTEKELQSKPVTDLGSAVGDVPGVDVSQTKMGNSTVSIRGFDAAYTLFMIDGKRQNVSTAMMDNGFDPTSAFIPPVGMIERIEVLRGPASVAWGSDAVGGVVNVITKRHPDQLTGSFTIDGTLQQHDEYGNRGGTSFYLGVPLKENVASLTLRGRYQKSGKDEIKSPNGTYATHSSTETYLGNFGGRLNLTVDPENFFYVDGDFTRFQGGSMQTSSSSIQSRRWYQKYNFLAGHEGTYDFGRTETYVMANGLDLLQTRTTLNPWSNGSLATPGTTSGSWNDPLRSAWSYTAATKFTSPVELDAYGSMMVTGGLEGTYETFKDTQTEIIRGQTLDQSVLSAFLESEYFMTEEWIATVGGRATWSDIFGAHFAPRAFLVFKPMDALNFKGGVSAGYKTPNVKQLTNGAFSGTAPGDRTFGNPDLKPEESWSYELSTTLDIARAAQLTVGGFYTDFKNMIATEDMSGAEHIGSDGKADKRQINYGSVRTRGIEVLLKTASFHGWTYSTGYTLTDAEIREGSSAGKRPNELPKHSWQNRIDYANGNFSAYLKSTSKFDMAVVSTKGAPTTDTYKDVTIVDLGASYAFLKNHRISVAVNNVLDQSTTEWQQIESKGKVSYANLYSDLVDGRNLWVSYNYSF